LSGRRALQAGVLILYCVLVAGSWFSGVGPGSEIGRNFIDFFLTMLRILPFAFVLISLFEVWVPGDIIERHLGEGTGIRGFAGAVVLAGLTIGGLFVALPMAYTLSSKGARLSVVFTYVGSAAVCRIPMTVFEASFMGLKFTLIRYAVSLPLVILTSVIMGRYLQSRGYALRAEEGGLR
jgi:uncharacterized membrane protein YraQ (UPF0718 family)